MPVCHIKIPLAVPPELLLADEEDQRSFSLLPGIKNDLNELDRAGPHENCQGRIWFPVWPCAPLSAGVAVSGKTGFVCRIEAAGQDYDSDTHAQTYGHTFSKPYIFISGYLISYAGWDWAECAHSCISITDHITVPQTFPLLIFTQSIQNNGPFLDSFFFHWPLIGCNYSSTKQMSVLRLPWRLDQGTQQCESFAGLHLYW